MAATNLHPKSVNDPLQSFESTLGILAIPGLQTFECLFDLCIHAVLSLKETYGNHESFVVSHLLSGNAIRSATPFSTIAITLMNSTLARRLQCTLAALHFFRKRFDEHPQHATEVFLLPLPENCIYTYEAKQMRVNRRVQEIWLRLLGAGDPSEATRIEMVEEGYYAVVRKAVKQTKCHIPREHEDFRAVRPFIPNFDHTRAVYLNQGGDYGLAKTESLHVWAGQLGEQVERGTRHAFAIVDTDVFAHKASASLRASGWKVEHVEDSLRVSDCRFTESANLLRAVVQMVLCRSTFAEAVQSLRAQLAGRFLMDAQLFARFEERFDPYRPAIIDRYFTVCPDCSRLARVGITGRSPVAARTGGSRICQRR